MNRLDRDGEQDGLGAQALVKRTPSLASRSKLGERTTGSLRAEAWGAAVDFAQRSQLTRIDVLALAERD